MKNTFIYTVSIITAALATGIVVTPLIMGVEWLELNDIMKLPDWMAMPVVFVIVGMFLHITRALIAYLDTSYS